MDADEMRTEWLRIAEERAERAEAERDDLARLLDEAIDREKVREAVIERVGIERQRASVDLERAQELLSIPRVRVALAEARERGEQHGDV